MKKFLIRSVLLFHLLPSLLVQQKSLNAASMLEFSARPCFNEHEIFREISCGNIPDFLRTLKKLTATFKDADGVTHKVVYEVMPDYLAIGSDNDFCRVAKAPITAQKLADLFGANLPTAKLVDDINLELVIDNRLQVTGHRLPFLTHFSGISRPLHTTAW